MTIQQAQQLLQGKVICHLAKSYSDCDGLRITFTDGSCLEFSYPKDKGETLYFGPTSPGEYVKYPL